MVARRGVLKKVVSPWMGCFPHPTGDHKSPPLIHPTALAPTESLIEGFG